MMTAPDIGPLNSPLKGDESAVPGPKKSARKQGGLVLDRPGETEGSWERWYFAADQPAELLPPESALPPQSEHLIALPTSTIYAWPLWVAKDGESLDFARLELSGRHLLKRGMEGSLKTLHIQQEGERQLILAASPEEPFPDLGLTEGWKKARRFDLPARLLAGSKTHDLIFWKEWGKLYLAFYRQQQPVWFCRIRADEIEGVVKRVVLRLRAEGVLEHNVKTIQICGLSNSEIADISATLGKIFPTAVITQVSATLPPLQRSDQFDLAPSEARQERIKILHRQQLSSYALLGGVIYLLLVIWAAGDLFIRENALKHLRAQISKIEQPALEAQSQSEKWRALRPVIDPDTYALDLLGAVAAPTGSGKARLTLFSLERGVLHISGEATDVTQAYSVIEELKKSPLLQQFEWVSSQPQLAGKNSVKFDMEGTRPDAVKKSDTP